MIEEPPIESLYGILFVGLFAFCILLIAYRYRYFKFTPFERSSEKVKLLDLLLNFAFFLLIPGYGGYLLLKAFLVLFPALSFPFPLYYALYAMSFTLLSLTLILFLIKRRGLFHLFFKEGRNLGYSLGFALLTYLVAFPAVLFIDSLFEYVNYHLFGFYEFEQVAVTLVKQAKENPYALVIVFISIVFGAPLIEELIFRGYLQTYLKRYIGMIPSLLLASLIFALFHFSPQQSYSNLPLLIALFSLSLFLGFVREKTNTLIASMSLHFLFNLVTMIRLLLIA
jgi:membrane protease YdiL (CAAX protease family)